METQAPSFHEVFSSAVSQIVPTEPAVLDHLRDARHFLDALARQAEQLGQTERPANSLSRHWQ
ncbi:hypothetical protein C8263_18105 [Deinococcus arcticus]|uniref:Uncharacterized protein n=1 Tax=Deinococcus arcticus TaxID=2136176 RepID=A0A2T3W3D2_9DEIO|nr:hypothetical protein C8263_18105 [Deinococcus arcticus]